MYSDYLVSDSMELESAQGDLTSTPATGPSQLDGVAGSQEEIDRQLVKTELPSDEELYYENQELLQRVTSQPIHEDDQELVRRGSMTTLQVQALRYRRNTQFPNPIEGPVQQGRLSRCTMFAYAPPSLTTVPIPVLISVFVIQFYEKVGAGLGLLAFFQGLARGFDVVTDPFMSYITDSCRSRQGRRRPFLFTGSPIYGLCLILLLSPHPSLGEISVSVWFGTFYIFFFLTATYCNIPYDALAPELTDNQDDRNSLFFTCTMFDGVGGLAVACLPAGFGKGISWYRNHRLAKYTSCDNPEPVTGRVDALSAIGPWFNGQSSAPPTIAAWHGNMTKSAIDYNFTRSMCPEDVPTTGLWSLPKNVSDLYTWCTCRAKADQVHGLDSDRYSYLLVGFFFGVWAWISLWICVAVVRERSQLAAAAKAKGQKKEDTPASLGEPRPLVPSILNTFQNKPFTTLLPPAILDAFANALISSLLTFFVRYIVAPEYNNKERWGCKPVGGSDNWQCSSDYVLAGSFLAFLMGALFFTPMWLFMAKKFGKRNVWLAWSFSNGVTFLAYTFVGPGDVYLCIIMSIINGAPAGAKFLADAIMADVIDYDEFLSGLRNEATYTMFKGFLPKIAAIPASAIPIALLASFGHVPVNEGVIQVQPQSVVVFIRVMIIWLPALLSFWAWWLKCWYPLRTHKQNELITEGIANHLLGKESVDPCSGVMYKLVHFDEKEAELTNLVDFFPGVQVVSKLLASKTYVRTLVQWMFVEVIFAVLWAIAFLLLSFFTFDLLVGDLSYIPVVAIVCFGLGITACGFTFMRLGAAWRLRKFMESQDLDEHARNTLKKLEVQRINQNRVRTFKITLDWTILKYFRKDGANLAAVPKSSVGGITTENLQDNTALESPRQDVTHDVLEDASSAQRQEDPDKLE
eukprot:g69819.t1